MRVLAIDPGNEQSAFCLLIDGKPREWATVPNAELLSDIRKRRWHAYSPELACEMIASYGMPVGREVFETCVIIGRIIEAWGGPSRLIYRKDVKLHLCGVTAAKDANIRQALIDIYGPGKDRAIGRKGSPGPLYGVHGDEWAALAVGVTAAGIRVRMEAAA